MGLFNKTENDYINIGYVNLNKGDYANALINFYKASDINPYSPVAWEGQALCYMQNGLFSQASICYGKVLEINPREQTALYNKGSCLISELKFQEAIYYFDKALELNPSYAHAHNNKGVALQWLGVLNEALKEFEAALVFSPEFVEAWMNKGCLLQELERYAESIQCFQHVLLKHPNAREQITFSNTLLEMQPPIPTYVLHHKGWTKGWIGKVFDGMKLMPKGVRLMDSKRYQEAKDCFAEMLDIIPSDAEEYIWMIKEQIRKM